ncbi:MAG: UDP-N-acetylmuramate dehydrogenase [Candidatus Dormibacteria bacterium]
MRLAEPLAAHSQYGIGGPADAFLEVASSDGLPEIVARAHEDGLALTVVGAGSNALILDGGIRGLVVKMRSRHLRLDGDSVVLDAGTMMPRAALDLARLGHGGMEWGIGVPGTAGASVWGNAGAFGSDVAGTMRECLVCAPDGTTAWRDTAWCGYSYRDSRFRRGDAALVLRARFAIRHGDPASVGARTRAVQAERKATQPYGVRSLGSTFKNPPGDHAGRLIEAAGLCGRRIGGAEVSSKHANFILNTGAASAADVVALIDLVHDEVASRFSVDLEREVVFLGEPQLSGSPA